MRQCHSGQDLLYLERWLDTHHATRPFGLVYFGTINPTFAGIDFVLPPKGDVTSNDRKEIARLPYGFTPGLYAISVNYLYGYPYQIHDPSGGHRWVSKPYYSYFRRFEPVATPGYSIYIYSITANDVEAAMRNQ